MKVNGFVTWGSWVLPYVVIGWRDHVLLAALLGVLASRAFVPMWDADSVDPRMRLSILLGTNLLWVTFVVLSLVTGI
jgi:hypothetical protein